jgi:hypothetical protein
MNIKKLNEELNNLKNALSEGLGPKEQKKYDQLKQIVKDHQYGKIDGSTIDVTTANAILTVVDGLKKDENKQKLLSMPIKQMVAAVWKLIK